MLKRIAYIFILFALMFGISEASMNDPRKLLEKAKRVGLKPIPNDPAELKRLIDPKGKLTPEMIELGRKLYYDPRLSIDNTVSCASCHNLFTNGADAVPVAVGVKGRKNPHHINSPTVYNAVFFDRQFWDGRSPDLEDQAQGPMQATVEMAITPEIAVKKITSIPGYVKEFKKVYGDNVKITFKLIADTIGAYERTLVTPSRFDDFLHGDLNALNQRELKGLKIFMERGCTNCHTGIAIGGSMQPFGVANDFKYKDVGDFKGDKNGLVKVPSLRNVTLTPPYFHNGTVDNLKDAIKEMSRIQLTLSEIDDDEVDYLISFFKALEGRKPKNIEFPKLPK